MSPKWKMLSFLIAPIVGTYLFGMFFNMVRMHERTTAQVEQRMAARPDSFAHHLDGRLRETAQVATMTAAFLETHTDLTSDQLYALLHENVQRGSLVYGSAFAFEPCKYKADQRLFVRYVHLDGSALRHTDPSAKPQRHPTAFYEDGRLVRWYENQVYKLPSGEVAAIYEDVTDR